MLYMDYAYVKHTYRKTMQKTVRFEIGGINKVKTTVTIPSFLKAMAIEKNLNLSLILENALKSALEPKKSGKKSNSSRTLVENEPESENKPILDLFDLINTYAECARADNQNNFFSDLRASMKDVERYKNELKEIRLLKRKWYEECKNPKDFTLPERLQIVDNYFNLKEAVYNSKKEMSSATFEQVQEMIDYWVASGNSAKDLKLPPPYDKYLNYFVNSEQTNEPIPEIKPPQPIVEEKKRQNFRDFYIANEKAFWNCTKKKVCDATTISSYKSALLKHEIGLIETPDDIGNFSEKYGKNMSCTKKNCAARVLNTFVKLRIKEFNGFTVEEFRFELRNINLGNKKREIIYDYTNDEIIYTFENIENIQAKKLFALMVYTGCRYKPLIRFLTLPKAEKEKRMTVKDDYLYFRCDGLGFDSKDFVGLFFPIEAKSFVLGFKKLERNDGKEYKDEYFSDKFMNIELPKLPEKPKQERRMYVSGVRKWFYNFATGLNVDKVTVDWICSRSEKDYSVGDTFYADKMTKSHKAYSEVILPELKKILNPRLFKRM